MLSIADNEYITRVGKGTPVGDCLRRSWSAVLDKKIPYPESPEMREMAAIKL